jgi:carboxypeptidase C (cathepsin A)
MAEDEAKKNDKNGDSKKETPPPEHHEDAAVTTEHLVRINGEDVSYTATAGRMVLTEEEGEKQASFFYIAYTRNDVEDVDGRPIMFAFNGGPGSSSVWLHLGAYGPRRVAMADDGMSIAPPARLIDNEHSLLDVADLVFIDPVSTGYSRAIPEEKAKDFHHFKKDIESVGEFIRLYLTRSGRWASPKYLSGESYGTLRSVGVAGYLWNRHGVALNGLLLISSILNYQTSGFDLETMTFRRGNDLPYPLYLPTYAATAHYHGALDEPYASMPLRDFLEEVEQFSAGEYATALFEGTRMSDERRASVVAQVAAYTGLDPVYVQRANLRPEILWFCKELLRDRSRAVGRIDSRFTAPERFDAAHSIEADPSLDAVIPAYTTAFNAYVRGELEYESDLPYEILSSRVRPWSYEPFQNAYVDVSETLRAVMTRNPFMRVFVANGYYDLATPYFATEYTFAHLDVDNDHSGQVDMEYYPAGHMMYIHLESLERMATDCRAFLTG